MPPSCFTSWLELGEISILWNGLSLLVATVWVRAERQESGAGMRKEWLCDSRPLWPYASALSLCHSSLCLPASTFSTAANQLWSLQILPAVLLSGKLCSAVRACCYSYRGLLTLYAWAVEPKRRDAVRVFLDVKDAFVVSLSGLRLGQILGQQSDWPHYSSGNIDLGGWQNLWTLLDKR